MADLATGPDPVTVVLALKSLDRAKSRLAGSLPPQVRRGALVTAMFDDTIAAVRASGVTTIVVVSPDPRVLRHAADLQIIGVAEPDGIGGLNAALRYGADSVGAGRAGSHTVAYLQADLPALRSESLRAAVSAARLHPSAFVADRSGTGTALLVVADDADFPLAFGGESARAHRSVGAVELDPGRLRWPDLRCDVDTPEDLAAAADLGLGPATAAALAVLVAPH